MGGQRPGPALAQGVSLTSRIFNRAGRVVNEQLHEASVDPAGYTSRSLKGYVAGVMTGMMGPASVIPGVGGLAHAALEEIGWRAPPTTLEQHRMVLDAVRAARIGGVGNTALVQGQRSNAQNFGLLARRAILQSRGGGPTRPVAYFPNRVFASGRPPAINPELLRQKLKQLRI